MRRYPLILTFTYTVNGDGYAARVTGGTRLLAHHADGEWVCSAVSFGGVETRGATLLEAQDLFLAEVRDVIVESASGVGFDTFEREILSIARSLDPDTADSWSAALEEFRRGALAEDGMEKLRRIREADIPPVAVQLLTAPGVVHEIRTELTIPMTQSRAA